MSGSVLHAVLAGHLRTLCLPCVARAYEATARRAREDGWPYEEYLHELLDAEIAARNENAARRLLRQARFPDIKTLDQIEWELLQGISRPMIHELSSCRFVQEA